jgi:hypothetical protein
MLDMVLEYRVPVKKMVDDGELGLRPYELSSKEWEIAQELRDVLKVRRLVIISTH